MSEYMEQVAQNQIEAGLSEREQLIERVEHLESELKKRDELIKEVCDIIIDDGKHFFHLEIAIENFSNKPEIKKILEGK